MLSANEIDSLRIFGYAEVQCISEKTSTLELSRNIGSILNLHTIDCIYPSVEVDVLTPKDKASDHLNRYHGNFGFGEYPAHTDFAHWFIPPRYLLLRARTGTSAVRTFIYPTHVLSDLLSSEAVHRALFFPRAARTVTALPFRIPKCDEFTIRYDSFFIQPANVQAAYCMEILRSDVFLSTRKSIVLSDSRHALVIDNWRCLHGRDAVQINDRNRAIERVYLEKIYGIPS